MYCRLIGLHTCRLFEVVLTILKQV